MKKSRITAFMGLMLAAALAGCAPSQQPAPANTAASVPPPAATVTPPPSTEAVVTNTPPPAPPPVAPGPGPAVVQGTTPVQPPPPTDVEEVKEVVSSGVFVLGQEQSDFRPLGESDIWWLKPNQDFKDRWQALANTQNDEAFKNFKVFVKVRGTRRSSPSRTYGHLGSAKAQIEVIEVLEMRVATPDDK